MQTAQPALAEVDPRPLALHALKVKEDREIKQAGNKRLASLNSQRRRDRRMRKQTCSLAIKAGPSSF